MNANRNDKQTELIKRLEEIRQKRIEESAPTNPSTRDPRTIEGRSSEQRPRRNEGAQTRPVSRTQTTQRRSTLSPSSQRTAAEQAKEIDRPTIYEQAQKEMTAPRTVETRRKRRTSKKTRKDSTLIQKLSSSQNLADALILSEILSKPIALRKRNR